MPTRVTASLSVAVCLCGSMHPQATAPDQALLAKARASYDSPFSRGLVSFDCAVDFNWKQHLTDVLGALPPTAGPMVERLQAIPHRIFVDRSGGVVSAQPRTPDLSAFPHAKDLESLFETMTSSGLNAWIPASTNVLLPVGPTKYSFEQTGSGYRLTMDGNDVRAQLTLDSELRLTSGVTERPQPMRFETVFQDAPNGYVLGEIRTETGPAESEHAIFTYKYADVDGFQLPVKMTVTSGAPPSGGTTHPDVWRYELSDCRTVKSTVVKVVSPR